MSLNGANNHLNEFIGRINWESDGRIHTLGRVGFLTWCVEFGYVG